MTSTVSDIDTLAGCLRLSSAYRVAKALLTAVDLDLFSTLHSHPATEKEIQQRLALHGRGLSDFLHLLVALGLLKKDGDHYHNTTSAEGYLVHGQQTYIGDYLQMGDRILYPAWGKLADTLRTGRPQATGNYSDMINDPEQLGRFVRRMDATAQVLEPELIKAIDWSGHSSVLDVGGCHGNIAAQIVTAHPRLTGHVFDLPQLEPFFTEHITSMGLSNAIRFHGGDFFHDPLPQADVVILGRVLHDWNREQRAFLFRKALEAANPGGALLVYDGMIHDESHHQHMDDLLLSLSMLLITERGAYPVSEIYEHASAAGVSSVTEQPLGRHTLVMCRVAS